MPLTDHVIDLTVQRYRREVDCYEKLCRFVAMKCEREIIRENTIRAGITYRAKSPNKLGAKLRKKYKDLPDLNTEEQALKRLSDLAGVRISTYLEADRAKVVEEIRKQFVGPDGGAVEVEVKGGSGFYRATHCQVALKPEDLDEPYDNLAGLTCEIQVCSLLAHVWNELEHDLVYKPTTGTLSPRETDSLNILGNLTLSGDLVIKQLFEANAARLKEAQTDEVPFQDVFDFVVRIRDFFPEQLDFGSNAGQLFEDLIASGIDTPAKIKAEFLSGDYKAAAAEKLRQFVAFLQSQNNDGVQVEAASSDILLVLFLDKYCDQVVSRHPTGRGRGRPPRIASFATRFQAMKRGTQIQDETAPESQPSPVK